MLALMWMLGAPGDRRPTPVWVGLLVIALMLAWAALLVLIGVGRAMGRRRGGGGLGRAARWAVVGAGLRKLFRMGD